MNAAPSAILPGFADPVHDAQRCFRAVLEALSRPGKPVALNALPPVPPLQAALAPACLAGMAAIALTLCDADTPVWLDARLDTPAMRRHLRFHCGCPLAAGPEQAGFAFIGDAPHMPRFERFFPGDPEYPDRSTTLVIAAELGTTALGATAPGRLLSGPGISPERDPLGLSFAPGGLPGWFWEDRARNQAGYPLGVDILFVDSRPSEGGSVRIAGLPRSAVALPNGADHSAMKENNACMSQ